MPHIGESAKELFVFQRTPSSIDVRNNQATDPDWIPSQEPGWHNKRRNNFETLLSGGMVKEDLVSDGWTEDHQILTDTDYVITIQLSKCTGNCDNQLDQIGVVKKLQRIDSRPGYSQ